MALREVDVVGCVVADLAVAPVCVVALRALVADLEAFVVVVAFRPDDSRPDVVTKGRFADGRETAI